MAVYAKAASAAAAAAAAAAAGTSTCVPELANAVKDPKGGVASSHQARTPNAPATSVERASNAPAALTQLRRKDPSERPTRQLNCGARTQGGCWTTPPAQATTVPGSSQVHGSGTLQLREGPGQVSGRDGKAPGMQRPADRGTTTRVDLGLDSSGARRGECRLSWEEPKELGRTRAGGVERLPFFRALTPPSTVEHHYRRAHGRTSP